MGIDEYLYANFSRRESFGGPPTFGYQHRHGKTGEMTPKRLRKKERNRKPRK